MIKVPRFVFVSVFIENHKTLALKENLFLNNNRDQDKTHKRNL